MKSNPQVAIRAMLAEDWPKVCQIYQAGIATQMATFETKIPNWSSWDQKYLSIGRLVAVDQKEVIGWTALSPASTRAVYRGVAELSIYIAPDRRGQKVGQTLLRHLIPLTEKAGFWTLQSSVFPENEASIRLHLRHGFRQIGFREKIAQLDGVWKDNLLFERRSNLLELS